MTVIIFIAILAVLVFVHELGHFVVARKAGARVEEFGIGFPPRLIKWKKGDTLYSINLIPLGGFVKIFGEDESEVKEPGAFGGLKISKRAKVLVAGVFMNALLAWIIFSVVAAIGQPTIINDTNETSATDVKVQILEVLENAPASQAGLSTGDIILGFDSVENFQSFVRENSGQEITISIAKGENIRQVIVTPRTDPPEGEGELGIYLAKTGIIKAPLYKAPWEGLKSFGVLSGAIIVFIVQLIGSIFSGGGGELVKNLAGPVGIANLTGEAAQLGFVYLLQFTAILSVNLAILNILPFPALDGGRLVFLAIEKIKGKPVNKEVEHATNMVGFALLILLIIFVTWQDVARFIL